MAVYTKTGYLFVPILSILSFFFFPIAMNYDHSSGSEDDPMRKMHVQSAVDKVVDMVQSVAGYSSAAESTTGNEGPAISQSGGSTESQSTAGVVIPDHGVVNPDPVQTSESYDKVKESSCCCLEYIRDFCKG